MPSCPAVKFTALLNSSSAPPGHDESYSTPPGEYGWKTELGAEPHASTISSAWATGAGPAANRQANAALAAIAKWAARLRSRVGRIRVMLRVATALDRRSQRLPAARRLT